MITLLPKGSIITEWLLPEWWLAKVTRAPKSGKGQQGNHAGRTRFKETAIQVRGRAQR